MTTIAESYLKRNRNVNSNANGKERRYEKSKSKNVPDVVLKGETGRQYRPIKFIAKGSAGTVYSAIRVETSPKLAQVIDQSSKGTGVGSTLGLKCLIQKQLDRQLVLKQIEPTQKNSAENEYRIAAKLRNQDTSQKSCVTYLDRFEEDGANDRLWLLLRRVVPSPYGVDLKQYIEAKFFNQDDHILDSQEMIKSLVSGVGIISSCNVSMRDVKPDNILVEDSTGLQNASNQYTARWSDFGLSIDLGPDADGSGLRHVDIEKIKKLEKEDDIVELFVDFWYDTQKLVPKPKFFGRRPPERCFQNPKEVPLCSYDIYMLGIIIVSMALGIDFPHLDKTSVKLQFEAVIKTKLSEDYLKNGRLGDWLIKYESSMKPYFINSFGEKFGEQLFHETKLMLAHDPKDRPIPRDILIRLNNI
mmetsp:Transcript_12020/g.14005  ORF Transcript_12020/g.14005 Transcript_12020/m.14005 type:complete len:415 (+) Transcript_12020:629-1873(+)